VRPAPWEEPTTPGGAAPPSWRHRARAPRSPRPRSPPIAQHGSIGIARDDNARRTGDRAAGDAGSASRKRLHGDDRMRSPKLDEFGIRSRGSDEREQPANAAPVSAPTTRSTTPSARPARWRARHRRARSPHHREPCVSADNRACQADNLTRRRNVAMFLMIGALALPRSRSAAGQVTGGVASRPAPASRPSRPAPASRPCSEQGS